MHGWTWACRQTDEGRGEGMSVWQWDGDNEQGRRGGDTMAALAGGCRRYGWLTIGGVASGTDHQQQQQKSVGREGGPVSGQRALLPHDTRGACDGDG